MQRLIQWLKALIPGRRTLGEQAMFEVADLVTRSRDQRQALRDAGWTHITDPPLVNNEFLWFHPSWAYKTQSEAVKYLPGRPKP